MVSWSYTSELSPASFYIKRPEKPRYTMISKLIFICSENSQKSVESISFATHYNCCYFYYIYILLIPYCYIFLTLYFTFYSLLSVLSIVRNKQLVFWQRNTAAQKICRSCELISYKAFQARPVRTGIFYQRTINRSIFIVLSIDLRYNIYKY